MHGLLIAIICLAITATSTATARPNIIFILCDDLGWGDLGLTFQNGRDIGPRHATPHLDRFAAHGMRLDAHYCPAPVCAPSRASLLRGLHQGHADIRDNQFDKALPDDHTLASVMKAAGYHTALVGKYGLQGDGNDPASWPAYPTKRGFDEFLGYVRHRDGHLHYPAHRWDLGGNENHREKKEVWHNDEEISPSLTGCFTSDLFTAFAKNWITERVRQTPDQPFFLYLAYDTPHAALQLPPCPYPDGGGLDGGVQWLGQDSRMINTATGTVDGWVHPDHQGWGDLQQRQAGMIRRIDDHIGDLAQLLRDLEIADSTLVVFTSDNGPHSESYIQGKNYPASLFQAYGPFNGIKRDILEGGIRVPTIASWPGTIPAASQADMPSQFHDWLNTFLDAAGLPLMAQSDGVSLLPTLSGQGTQVTPQTYIEYKVNGTTPDYADFEPIHRNARRGQMQVLFTDGFKGLRRDIQGADDNFQIFDLAMDHRELNDLAPVMPELNDRMKAAVLQMRRPNPTAPRPYDETPIPPVAGQAAGPGLKLRMLPGEFPWVPVIPAGATAPLDVEDFTFDVAGPGAVEVSGFLDVKEEGEYAVQLTSPDAAVLHIHQALVIDADTPAKDGGSHKANIRLLPGLHPFRLSYLTTGENARLQLAGPAAVDFVR